MAASSKARSRVSERIVLRLAQDGKTYSVRRNGVRKEQQLNIQTSKALKSVLEAAKPGHRVYVIDKDQELTPNQAAGYLGVSRPFLRAQMDAGRISYRKLGTHHRLRRSDLAAFRKAMSEQEDALQRLADIGQSSEANISFMQLAVVLDANVLFGACLRDCILSTQSAVAAGSISPHIQRERVNHLKAQYCDRQDAIDEAVKQMNQAFPQAMVRADRVEAEIRRL